MTSTNDEIVHRSAVDLARLIRSREVSAAEVIEAFIARNEELHASLNALVVPRYDDARRAAAKADEALAKGAEVGPLHGVPITIKEQYSVAGTPTTFGLPSRKEIIETSEGPLVSRLREAGAIILGKTNVSQFLIFLESDNPVYGRTQNPWNLERSCGGSSGGEAAIVAAYGSSLGLAGDLGGSIRVPAHFCGVHGLKPTAGRLTNRDTLPELDLSQEGLVPQPGPIARHVDDLALAMQVLAGPRSGALDVGAPPVPWTAPRVPTEKLRVGYFEDDGYFTAAPGIRRVVREAAQALASAGAVVEELQPSSVADAMRLFAGMISADQFTRFRRMGRNDPIDRRVRGLFMLAGLPTALLSTLSVAFGLAGQKRLSATLRASQARSAEKYFALLKQRNALRQTFIDAMEDKGIDVLLCPPCAVTAFTHGASEFLFEAASTSVLFNVLGFPAGVVAAGRVRAGEESDRPESRDQVERAAKLVDMGSVGLPIGVQVAARPWREDLVLAAMRALETHFRATSDYPSLDRSQAPISRQYVSASTSGASARKNSTDTAPL
jgi:fatty acid amide hydrolase